MRDETAGVATKEFGKLKLNMYWFLVDDSSGHKKTKGVNKNGAVTIIRSEYKDVFLNKKCLRHSMNKIQRKDHRTGTYEINKISLSCTDEKIYIQNNGYDRLALAYQN